MTPTQTTPAASPKGKGPATTQAQPVSRRARKKERTRQRIYEAAMALFSERGFDDVTIEEICEAADVAKATFFLHFPTKASLAFENTRRVARQLRAEMDSSKDSMREQLTRTTHLMLGARNDQYQVMGAMFRDLLSSSVEEISKRPENHELMQVFIDLFRRGQQTGEFRGDVLPEVAAVSLFATACSLATAMIQFSGKFDLIPIFDQFLTMVFDGLVEPEKK